MFRAFDTKKNGLVSQPLLHKLLLKARASALGSMVQTLRMSAKGTNLKLSVS